MLNCGEIWVGPTSVGPNPLPFKRVDGKARLKSDLPDSQGRAMRKSRYKHALRALQMLIQERDRPFLGIFAVGAEDTVALAFVDFNFVLDFVLY